MNLLDQFRANVRPILRQPWLGWLVITLCRQRARQAWLVRVRDELLDGLDDRSGTVPEPHSAWRYDFHGRGLLLEGPTGEYINVDLFADFADGSVVDPYFFIWRLESLRDPGIPETRLREWLPGKDTLLPALRQLRAIGVIHHPESQHVFLLHPWLEQHASEIASVRFEDADTRSAWARALGDSSHEGNGAGDPRFVAWVEQLATSREDTGALQELAEVLPRPTLVQLATSVLTGPVDTATARALLALRAARVEPPTAATELLQRLDPELHHPFPAHALASYLLDAGFERNVALDVIDAFAGVEVVKGYSGNPYADKLAILMLKHAPARAAPLVEKALRSTTPMCYQAIAALLSLIDTAEARTLMLEVASVSEPTKKRFLLAALWFSTDPATREAAVTRMPAPPDRQSAVGYTFEEVAYANLRQNVEYHRNSMRQVLADLRPH